MSRLPRIRSSLQVLYSAYQSPLIDVDISIFENVISVNKTIARAAARALLSQGIFSVAQTALLCWFLLNCLVEITCLSAGVLALLGVSSARQLYAIGTFLALLKSVVVVYVIMVLWRQYMYKYCPVVFDRHVLEVLFRSYCSASISFFWRRSQL